jgi:hypothetical protein
VYPHLLDGEQFGVAVVAGELYQNATVGALEGKLVIADFLGGAYGQLFATRLEQTASGLAAIEPVSVVDDVLSSRAILSMDRGEDGELYVLTTPSGDGTGTVFKLVAAD